MAIGLKKRRRVQLIVIAIFFIFVATFLIGFAFKDGIEFFRSPTQVISESISENEVTDAMKKTRRLLDAGRC